jgi:hypothetical protein
MGRLLPHLDDTEPIPLPPTPASGLPAVKAAETCGPCGSSFEVEWVGRTDTLTVIRDWRTSHRCHPPAIPDTGVKGALIERVGFGLD